MSASSEVEIVNSAFVKIGEQTVPSLQDDRRQAQLARRQYSFKRDELIRSYRWNFAVSRAQLAPEADQPPFGFKNKFLQPTDNLRILGVWQAGQAPQNYTGGDIVWKKEGPYILADDDLLNIFYMRQETNPVRFDPLFTETLAWFLAYDLAFALSTGPNMVSEAFNGFQQALRQARFADAIETTPEVLRSSEWLESRFEGTRPPRIGPVNNF